MRFQAVAQNRLPHVLFLSRTIDERKSDFVRTGRYLMRGEVMRLSTSSREMTMFFPLDSWSSFPPTGAEKTCSPSTVTMN